MGVKDSRTLTDEVYDRLDGQVESFHQTIKATLAVLEEWGFLVTVVKGAEEDDD